LIYIFVGPKFPCQRKDQSITARDIDFKKSGALAGTQRWITSDSVGPVVIDAMRRGALYVTTHDDIADMFEKRANRILEQLRAPVPATENVD
jgi:hypothetical protein